jgi:protein-disulfide isomerase
MSQKTARRQRAVARSATPSRPGRAGMSRTWLYGGLAAAAVAVVVALVVASQLGGEKAPPPLAISGAETAALLDGIPQDGISLGSPDAPVVLSEFADLQCPFCQNWASEVMPVIVEEYVRAGDVRLEFRGLSFIGPDSVTALRTVLAAGEQDRLWHVVDLLYRQQGGENEGWVTERLLNSIGGAVAGLDTEEMLGLRESSEVADGMAGAGELAARHGIDSTPSFLVARAGEEPQRLEIEDLDPAAFRAALDELLGR